MKPILILGPARAGKSTLSRLVKERLPAYNIIHGDALRNAIMYGLPQRFPDELLNYEANDFFARLALEFVATQNAQDKGQQGVIFEGSQILPHHLAELAAPADAIVVFIGHGQLTPDEYFAMIRHFDTPADWSYRLSDAELRARVAYFASVHERFAAECTTFGHEYVDTTADRSVVLARLADQIAAQAQA